MDIFNKYPKISGRDISQIPLQKGDLVADAAYSNLPRMLDEGIGRILAVHSGYAKVAWRDGTEDIIHTKHLVRIQDQYEPMVHESAYEIPKWSKGTRVILGNGDHGRILEEVTGPTGFKSYKIKIEKSVSPTAIGRHVYATNNGMYRVAGLPPDVVTAIYKDGDVQPFAMVGCELAVDEDEQMVGLQKYSSLPFESGMLFPYDPPRKVTFHMGSVQFPIDVIFINQIGRIAAIEANREPGVDSYWTHGKVSAVLEVNGGWCEQNGVMVGDLIRLNRTKMAQEVFEPSHNRTDHAVRPNTSDMDPNRFKGHDTPDNILNSGDSFSGAGDNLLDSAHHDMTIGYDPTKDLSESGVGPMRPAAKKK